MIARKVLTMVVIPMATAALTGAFKMSMEHHHMMGPAQRAGKTIDMFLARVMGKSMMKKWSSMPHCECK